MKLPLSVVQGWRSAFAVSTLGVDEPVQSVVWQGQPAFRQFLVTIPEGTNGQSFFPVVRVSVNGSLIGCIKFRISSDQKATDLQPAILGDHACRYKKAFVSYATIDRKEVLKRVQMLEILKTQLFQDVLSLEPGDRWEKKLYEEIKYCGTCSCCFGHRPQKIRNTCSRRPNTRTIASSRVPIASQILCRSFCNRGCRHHRSLLSSTLMIKSVT